MTSGLINSQEIKSKGKMEPIPFHDEIDTECAIYVKNDGGSCVPHDVLARMIDGAASLDRLKDATGCGTELCVVSSQLAAKALGRDEQSRLLRYFFKIKGPDKSTDWLSNFEIDDVLDQAANKYTDFLHVTFQMRDFAEMNTDSGNPANLANLNWPQHFSEKKCFGTVINTDYSTGGGVHWFAVFGDFREEPYTIEYFNSSGELPLKEIKRWMLESAAAWGAIIERPVVPVVVSRIQHQKDNHSCGTYALYYILSRLYGTSYKYFNTNFIKDATMHDFRRRLFR